MEEGKLRVLDDNDCYSAQKCQQPVCSVATKSAPAWPCSSHSLSSLGLHMDAHQDKLTQKMGGRDSPL